jgi:hypothetical protein
MFDERVFQRSQHSYEYQLFLSWKTKRSMPCPLISCSTIKRTSFHYIIPSLVTVVRIYLIELEIKDTRYRCGLPLYDKRDFNFPSVNIPFICSNFPEAHTYEVYIKWCSIPELVIHIRISLIEACCLWGHYWQGRIQRLCWRGGSVMEQYFQ